MKTIKNNIKNEIVINKSRFITYLFNVSNINDINNCINEVKQENKDATHIVTAYILDNDSRSNDNNEPKGTAGLPSLEVLRKENLINILVTTVRYFGGIKLGASGLTRAYSNSVSEALKKADLIERIKVIYINLELSYKDYKLIENKDYIIIDDIQYNDLISINGKVIKSNIDKLNDLFNYFKDDFKYTIVKESEEFI